MTRATGQSPAGDSVFAPAADCVVCGAHITPGDGVTASSQGRLVRLGGMSCLHRFYRDPVRYLEPQPVDCPHGHPSDSPASDRMTG